MVQIANPAGAIKAVNGALPCEGTKIFPFTLNFNLANAYQVDLTQQFMNREFSTLQTVWIDNSINPQPLQIVCSVSGQVITAPPLSQGFYTMLQPSPWRFVVQTSGVLIMQIILLNFYIPPTVWDIQVVSAGGLPQIDIPAIDAIISGGGLNVNSIPFTVTGLVDGSSTITVGGTTQSALVANAGRKYVSLSNPDTATETLYYCWGAAGAGKIPLLPGATYESGGVCVGDQLFVLGATAGHAYTLFSK